MVEDIDALRRTREDKFDEICSTIAFAYGAERNSPLTFAQHEIRLRAERKAGQLLKKTVKRSRQPKGSPEARAPRG
jgi:hypothetical protein